MGFRNYFTTETDRKKQDEDAALLRQLISSNLMRPNVPDNGLITQGPDGPTVSVRRPPSGVAGTDSFMPPASTTEPLTFKPNIPARDPSQLVKIDASMSEATGLPVGSYAPMWQIEKIYAPGKRAETLSMGQTGRQQAGFKRENVKDALAAADRAVTEFTKTVTGQVAAPETIKAIRDKAFEDALDQFGVPNKSPGKSKEKTDQGESATRKQNPTTKKWWIYKNGKWQEE